MICEKCGNELHQNTKNSGCTDFANPSNVSLVMGTETETTFTLPSGSKLLTFDQNETIGGQSISDLIVMEIKFYGNVYLWIHFVGWAAGRMALRPS